MTRPTTTFVAPSGHEIDPKAPTSFSARWRIAVIGKVVGILVVALGLAIDPAERCLGAETYIVRKRDTLLSIAREHGVSVNQLIQFNGLSRSGYLAAGQRLKIPGPEPGRHSLANPSGPGASSSSLASSGLSAWLRRSLDRVRLRPGQWDYIVVHHSATPMGTAKAMDRYHREQRHMENGLAYHFVVGNGRGMRDGEVVVGHRWTRQLPGGHLASEALNARSLGICLVGNFDRDHPTKRQLDSLNALTEYLMKRCDIPRSGVKTHQQINPIGTRCPGRLFDDEAFLRGLD